MTVDFIRCKSYENTDSGDEVRITGAENLEQSLRGKVVLLAEDIIDTGKSMMVRTILHELNCKLVGDLFKACNFSTILFETLYLEVV